MKKFIILFSIVFLAMSLQSCWIFSILTGKTWYTGEESWKDPVGAQVAIEAKVVEINKQSFITAGLGYSMQGSAYGEQNFSGKVKANYLIAPLLYYYQNPNGFYAEAGLQPSILLSARDKYKGGEGGYSYEGNDDYKDAMKTFNLGVPVGAGYRFKNGVGLGCRMIVGATKNHKEGNSRDMLILIRASVVLDDILKKKK